MVNTNHNFFSILSEAQALLSPDLNDGYDQLELPAFGGGQEQLAPNNQHILFIGYLLWFKHEYNHQPPSSQHQHNIATPKLSKARPPPHQAIQSKTKPCTNEHKIIKQIFPKVTKKYMSGKHRFKRLQIEKSGKQDLVLQQSGEAEGHAESQQVQGEQAAHACLKSYHPIYIKIYMCVFRCPLPFP